MTAVLETYLNLYHEERDESLCAVFEQESGDYLRGHIHFPDGTQSDLPDMVSLEAALIGVGW